MGPGVHGLSLQPEFDFILQKIGDVPVVVDPLGLGIGVADGRGGWLLRRRCDGRDDGGAAVTAVGGRRSHDGRSDWAAADGRRRWDGGGGVDVHIHRHG